MIAENLSNKKLFDVLERKNSWTLDEKTVIIAEELVMYLPPESVRDLFEQCAFATGPGSRIAFSYIPMGKDNQPDVGYWTGLMLWLQKVAGEPWQWSILPEELGMFLSETGWTESIEHEEAGRKYGVEYFAVGINHNHKGVKTEKGERGKPNGMSDIALSEAMGWGLIRTQTLADGCLYCDFRFKESALTRISSKIPEVQEAIERINRKETK